MRRPELLLLKDANTLYLHIISSFYYTGVCKKFLFVRGSIGTASCSVKKSWTTNLGAAPTQYQFAVKVYRAAVKLELQLRSELEC